MSVGEKEVLVGKKNVKKIPIKNVAYFRPHR